jgi:hypothetical protein
MKRFSQIWFAGSIAVLPCILNLENVWCCLILAASIVLSFRSFRKHNPEYIIH